MSPKVSRLLLLVSFISLTSTAYGAPAISGMSGSEALGHVAESRAGLAPESVVMNAADPRVYPNPWRADRNSGASVTFDRLPADSSIRIFTISGQEVKNLDATNGTASWDRTNESGERVASGVYLYLVTDILGQESHGKIAIIN